MVCIFSAGRRLVAAGAMVFILLLAPPLRADEPPDAQELLKMARLLQGSQDWKFTGYLRVGREKQPFKLDLEKGAIRYQFLDNGDTITLRLGEKSTTLEEKRGGKTAQVSPARFDQPVRGTDIHYEDIALRFLYWNDAKVIGSDTISAHSCWKVEVRPPAKNESEYSRVVLSIGKEDGALMKAECFDANDKWLRRFTVTSVMKREGAWLLKEMRVESSDGRHSDPQPTYLHIDDIVREGGD